MNLSVLDFIKEEQLGGDVFDAFEELVEAKSNFVDISKIKEGEITFQKEVIDAFYLDGIINDNTCLTINLNNIISNLDNIPIIMKNANKFLKLADSYNFDESKKKDRLCAAYYLLSYSVEKKYEKIQNIEDIVETVPFSILSRVVNDNKDAINVSIKKNGIEYAGLLNSINLKTNFMGISYIVIQIETIMLNEKKEMVRSYIEKNISPISMVNGLEDLGIKQLSNEDIEKFKNRGKEIIEVLKKDNFKRIDDFVNIKGFFGNLDTKYINSRIIIDGQMLRREDSDLYAVFFKEDQNPKINVDINELIWAMQPDIPAFSLNDKIWFVSDIDKIKNIKFNEEAFNELKIKDKYKELLLCMIDNNIPSFDPISEKGKGKIFLLNGNPGIGKTLTAEAIAEYLHRPLYFVSVGELGVDTEELEYALNKIINLTKKWNAIVLIDEVDVFAQKRNTTNLESNAMTAVFLRMIERFEGLMFMTTNMCDTLDEAFVSRATLVLDYKDLTCDIKKQIFSKCIKDIEKNGIKINISDKYLNKISRCKLNGRIIKNIMRLSYALALKDKLLNEDKIDTVLEMYKISNGED